MRFLLLYDKNGVLQTGQIRSICESRGIKAVFSAHHSWRHLLEQNFLLCGVAVVKFLYGIAGRRGYFCETDCWSECRAACRRI